LKKLLCATLAGAALSLITAASASAAVTLQTPSCSLSTGCLFSGNDDYAGAGDDIEAAYNAAFPGAPIQLEKLGSIQSGQQGISGKNGVWSWPEEVKYFSVKASTYFMLYEVKPNDFSWTTAGITNNGGQQPNISHITFWGGSTSAVPEPGAWALMIAGFGMTGLALRRRRAAALAA
jgi:hypothetical protein